MINFVIEDNWKWSHCRLPIKRTLSSSKKRDQQYFYQVINSSQMGPVDEDRISIELDKEFPFQPDTGFIWHKSWNLPEINLTLNRQQSEELFSHYQTIKCQIMAVYPIKYSNSYYLNEINLEGTCVKLMHDNNVAFRFLKFVETSFNHNRNKFCLLLWVYGENQYKDKDDIFCIISSPIYVDSRKEARKKQSNYTSAPLLHSPNKFINLIKNTKGLITNTIQGFISYYSAQNIRNKIKHPFYIAYHFDKIFKLYKNVGFTQGLVETLGIIEMSKNEEKVCEKDRVNESVILLQIVDWSQKCLKRLLSILDKWKLVNVEVCYEGLIMENKWQIISKQSIKVAYQEYYEREIIKQEDIQIDIKARHDQDRMEDENGNINIDRRDQDQEQQNTNNAVDKQRAYELRTIIELSKPKKKVKLDQQII